MVTSSKEKEEEVTNVESARIMTCWADTGGSIKNIVAISDKIVFVFIRFISCSVHPVCCKLNLY